MCLFETKPPEQTEKRLRESAQHVHCYLAYCFFRAILDFSSPAQRDYNKSLYKPVKTVVVQNLKELIQTYYNMLG